MLRCIASASSQQKNAYQGCDDARRRHSCVSGTKVMNVSRRGTSLYLPLHLLSFGPLKRRCNSVLGHVIKHKYGKWRCDDAMQNNRQIGLALSSISKHCHIFKIDSYSVTILCDHLQCRIYLIKCLQLMSPGFIEPLGGWTTTFIVGSMCIYVCSKLGTLFVQFKMVS